MSILALRHLDASPELLRALTAADWAGAGLDVTDVAPLGQPLSQPLDQPSGAAAGAAVGTLVALGPRAGDDVARLREQLKALAHETPTFVVLDGAAQQALAELLGVRLGATTPEHEIRLRPEPGVDPRRVDDLLVTGALHLVEGVDAGVRVLATANVAFRDHPALTYDPASGIGFLAVTTAPQAWRTPELARFLRLAFAAARGDADPAAVGVGMVGYGAIGHEHALAVQAVPGLRLAGVSDLSSQRLDVARALSPGISTSTDAAALLTDDDVDLVVVSTPPNTHAEWALRALQAGKHVVLEKPMALSTAECDEVMRAADEHERLVVVYQNRRYDPDYLTLRRLVRDGAVGELFHLETFVGAYQHPCNYWHSDATVSGGAIFDWGSHVIDQILDLMPGEVRAVSAANHKRKWFDVTNADHSRVTIHFDDGREAQFVYSDLAAAPKPKWWALGTEGALVGRWRSEKVVSRTAIGTLDEDLLALADSPADIELHSADGSVAEVPVGSPLAQPFHRVLADQLLLGLPMGVTREQSRRVVAVMAAAETSAASSSAPVGLS